MAFMEMFIHGSVLLFIIEVNVLIKMVRKGNITYYQYIIIISIM